MGIAVKNLQKKFSVPEKLIRQAAQKALRKLKSNRDISIVLVSPKRMRGINKKYLNHDYVTDVLSFDLGDEAGEIVICPQVASVNARHHQTSTQHEIMLYVVHGILHLAGFDDKSETDKKIMRKMESKILE